jgi:hypothetical protein
MILVLLEKGVLLQLMLREETHVTVVENENFS